MTRTVYQNSLTNNMCATTHCSLHPQDKNLPLEFSYGDMHVIRKPLSANSKGEKRMVHIFESYIRAGVFPESTTLTEDYLEHTLVKNDSRINTIAGRYLGVVMPNGSYQYVRLEGESIGIEKRNLQPPEEIIILTDTCLFCAANATATLESGESVSIVAPKTRITSPVAELEIAEQMCPYEMDSIVRLTDLVTSLGNNRSIYCKAILAMPTVEYCLYLMDTYNSNLLEKGLMQKWIEQVNVHASKIVNAISKRAGLEIELCQPLHVIEQYIWDCVNKGKPADFEQVLSTLSGSSDLWKHVLPITRPKNWKALNYSNYVVALLESSVANKDTRLTIDVENPSEQRILRNASKVALKLDNQGYTDHFRTIGIYPHEKVFISSTEDCSGKFPRLYYLEQQNALEACFYKDIVVANRRKMLY